jgi:DNA-binding Xre family transcriptional regulator
MSLRDAIARLAEIRGMKTPEVTDSVAGTRNRATLYRILSGATTDPRTSTMLELCRTLHTDPGELLGLAGLLRPRSGKPTLLDVAQRQAFRELRELG